MDKYRKAIKLNIDDKLINRNEYYKKEKYYDKEFDIEENG
jgi:hypothetical protein